MDDPPAVGSAGFQRRERERAEAKREADAAAKAKAVLEKRLQEAQADLFKHAGSGAEAGKQHELDRLRGEISDQIKRDVEKAKREAEAEREFRKAEAVISQAARRPSSGPAARPRGPASGAPARPARPRA